MKKSLWGLILMLGGLVVFDPAQASAIESKFHGQFRINSYMQSQGEEETFGKEVRASRLRYRPTWDVKLDNDVQMHLQLNIGHIKENTSNARRDNGGSPAFGLRHAYVLTPLKKIGEGWLLIGGLVPVSDKFGDTLFSGDWDFNPLTYAVLGDVEGLKVRVGAAKLVEGSESNSSGTTGDKADDLSAYVLDVDKGKFGGSYYLVTSDDAFGAGNITQNYYGVRYSDEFDGIGVSAFLLGNSGTFTKGGAFARANDDFTNSGFAGKVAVTIPTSAAKIGILGIYAAGDKAFRDPSETKSGSFITPMSLIGHHGYWGYTGKLTIQGPTDTGIDDPINIDGGSYSNRTLGLGLNSLQVMDLCLRCHRELSARPHDFTEVPHPQIDPAKHLKGECFKCHKPHHPDLKRPEVEEETEAKAKQKAAPAVEKEAVKPT